MLRKRIDYFLENDTSGESVVAWLTMLQKSSANRDHNAVPLAYYVSLFEYMSEIYVKNLGLTLIDDITSIKI